MFSEGNIVILRSCSSGKNLRIYASGVVEGIGGDGYLPHFRVHVRGRGVVALQNFPTPEHWIAIKDGETIGTVCYCLNCSSTDYVGNCFSFVCLQLKQFRVQ